MKLTKQQRAQLQSQSQRAAIAALRDHFVGEGAMFRRLQFLRRIAACLPDQVLTIEVWDQS